jgi:hypothetical protein
VAKRDMNTKDLFEMIGVSSANELSPIKARLMYLLVKETQKTKRRQSECERIEKELKKARRRRSKEAIWDRLAKESIRALSEYCKRLSRGEEDNFIFSP